MIEIATIVDGSALLQTVIASVVAGVGITAVASTAIFGFATLADARRDGRPVAAAASGLLAFVATLVFAAAIVAGLIVMIRG